MPLNKALITLSIIVLTVVFAVLLYKILRAVSERLGFYNALKKFCAQNGGEIKKNNGLFKPVFAVYPGCDVEMTVGGTSYGVKFFPKYLKNKTLLIESERRACLLKNVGSTSLTTRGSFHGVGSMPTISDEVMTRNMKIDLTGAKPDRVNILIFTPKCKRIYYVKKTERAEAYNGDGVFGFTVFYAKNALWEYLRESGNESAGRS